MCVCLRACGSLNVPHLPTFGSAYNEGNHSNAQLCCWSLSLLAATIIHLHLSHFFPASSKIHPCNHVTLMCTRSLLFSLVFVIWRWTLEIWRLSVPEPHMRTCEDASGPTDFPIVLFWLTDVKGDVLYRCHLGTSVHPRKNDPLSAAHF